MPDSAPVALLKTSSYRQPELRANIFRLMEAAAIEARPGLKVLVKPNLLMAHELACTNPQVVASACEWLLAKGASVIIADSPAFGTAPAVAAAIGLEAALKPLGLAVTSYSRARKIALTLPNGASVQVGVAPEALECDLILSVPRIKAHSQMRITLAVKNCYGCICGIRKAICHVRFGRNREYFSDCVAALWAALPQVAGLYDGITAMNNTGPRNGQPFALDLLAASASAAAADTEIIAMLGLVPTEIPLAAALRRRGVQARASAWPLLRREDFSAAGFSVPKKLKDISFNPLVLAKSIIRRLWLERK